MFDLIQLVSNQKVATDKTESGLPPDQTIPTVNTHHSDRKGLFFVMKHILGIIIIIIIDIVAVQIFIGQFIRQYEASNSSKDDEYCGCKAFEDKYELIRALHDNNFDNPLSIVSLKYGYPINAWDVSKITDFSQVFYYNPEPFNEKYANAYIGHGLFRDQFNSDISNWDVSNAMNMSQMFDGQANFNQDISQWDVSNVIDMSDMFR